LLELFSQEDVENQSLTELNFEWFVKYGHKGRRAKSMIPTLTGASHNTGRLTKYVRELSIVWHEISQFLTAK
jgi:hypothetical protein